MSKTEEHSRAERVRDRRRRQSSRKIGEMPIYKPVEPLRPSKETSFIGPKKRKTKIRTYTLDAIALP